jgi:tetratricopeptide (TPR) repeat protein
VVGSLEAVREYEEAVKRAPKNAAIRNNLSAALCKIMDFTGAQRQIETALDLDPQYVKAWARKGVRLPEQKWLLVAVLARLLAALSGRRSAYCLVQG